MNITILSINFYPELIGIGVYNTEMCEYLVEQGHKVTMITAFPYYPQWKIPPEYKKNFLLLEWYKGIEIKRSYVYVPKTVSAKNRILHELSFIISSFFQLLFSKKPDVLVTISPPLGLGLTSYLISRIKKIPFVFHVQDLQPDAAVNLGMLKKGSLINFLFKIERLVYQKASLVSGISNDMVERIRSKGVDNRKTILFPNWVDINYIKPMARNNGFRDLYNLGDNFLVLYSGNMGVKQGLEVVLDVAKLSEKDKNILYVIGGDGVQRKYLEELLSKMGLNNVRFLPTQSRKTLPSMLSAADISLVIQKKSVTDIVMPSKLLGIMASGKPVIASANKHSVISKTVKNINCGIVVPPENPHALYNAILELKKDGKRRALLGKNGQEYVARHFSKEKVLRSFEQVLLNL